MKKYLVLLLFVFGIFSTAFAQIKTGKISGVVIDGSQKTIESSTITLQRVKDSSIAKMSYADKNGKFEFENIAEGKYFVSVTAVGHQKGFSESFEISVDNNSIILKPIELIPQSKNMSDVVVTSRKPMIEQKVDRTIINVDATISNVGATALEVLEKSPGITIDKDGNISLKGKQQVQVYVDGRPSYLSGEQLVALLRSMNASQLDQIEIMTNPPAKYDAAGNAGIINIKTKKIKQVGLNGNVTSTYSQGKYWRINETINMNYRTAKFNSFMTYNYYNNNSFQELTIHRTYRKPDNSVDAMFDQVAFLPGKNKGHNFKLGMDYFIDKNTTIGFVASGYIHPEHQLNYNTAYLKNSNNVVDSIVYSTSNVNEKWKNGTVNLNFRHQFDSTGKELTADLDYSGYKDGDDQLFTNSTYNPDWTKRGTTNLLGNIPVNIKIYSAKADYVHPLKKNAKVEAGLKSSYVDNDDAANYYNLAGGNWEIDYDKTNRFQYKENINSAYINFSKQIKKLEIQTGLRFENTNYNGHQIGNAQKADSSFNNHYNSLFPTLYLAYSANDKNQFGFNLGRRIDRPAYQDLNPFLFFLDNYTYQSGNPFLKPQYSWNLELSHTYKGFLITTINYSRTNNYFTETFEQSGYASIVRNGNIGARQSGGISMSAQLNVRKWWAASLYGNYNYSHYHGELYGETLDAGASNILFNVNNQFKFEKGLSGELSGFYRSKGIEGQIEIEPMGQLSTGISKQVMKGKGSLRFKVRDIFYTNWARGSINFQSTEATFKNKRDTRLASVSFTYRFGKPIKGSQSNRKNGGAEDEQSRVKAGGNN